ncbi:hypothetical protein L211DRAFT_881522 [Terfezia boudieri ATCC MYA-4762]|uniref:HTH CENPB-type domain-containing protein n=1 Tax=Terfezia boudieri ATCC MYA-4762 TaxID=1051890 RepID=A0A3N4MLE1_9PEZI|nr:hypothetical protein L211DRAFT_881522 [Terfezia boudieri ATCC MYA-4762]
MPPKRPGPIVENTVKRPRSQFPLNKAKASVPEQTVEVNTTGEATNELAEIHTLASLAVIGQRRKQYTREFKLATITYWRKYSISPPEGLGLSKYAVAKRLKISERMLGQWIKNEAVILAMKTKQKKATTGRIAQFPEMENHSHEKFLKLRETGVKIGWSWFEASYPERIQVDALGNKLYTGCQFSRPWFARFKQRKNISLRRITNKAQNVPADSESPIRVIIRQ